MRSPPSQPAQQLHSAAARYRLPRAWAALRLSASAWPGVERRKTSPTDHCPFGQRSAAATDPFDRDALLARLEAVLFLAREPLNSRKLSQLAGLADGTQARTLVRRLNELYDGAGRAFRVEQVAGGYQLLTRRKFAPWLRRLAHVPGETRLSAPALETLAVIAYRQPVPRADIEAIRGVNCGEILRQLVERDFVRIGGRSQELGRPYLYSTTKRFLQIFGLVNLDDLPSAEALRQAPLPAAPPLGAPLALAGAWHEAEPTDHDERGDESPDDEILPEYAQSQCSEE